MKVAGPRWQLQWQGEEQVVEGTRVLVFAGLLPAALRYGGPICGHWKRPGCSQRWKEGGGHHPPQSGTEPPGSLKGTGTTR